MKLSLATVGICIFAFGGFLSAQTLPAGVTRGSSVEGITEYQVPNGLKVLMFPDPSKNTITVNITFLVGSRNENYGETGMAHLLEHMVFKGTPNHPDVPKELSNHGARPNGSTWYDRTNYFETFSATEENLRWALDLESDRMIHSYVAKKDLDTEMTVVRNEFESGENSPFRILSQRLMSTAYEWHNYGKETIGAKSDLENEPIERLQAFYRTYYQPDNAVLLVAGKIDEAKTLQMVVEYFGKVPRPARTLQNTYTLDPVQDGERSVAVRRVGDVQIAGAVYHVPDAGHPDLAPLEVLADMMSRPNTGRLYKALVESKKAASVESEVYQLKEPGVILFFANVRKENSLDEARDTLLRTIEDFTKTPPTAEEVERSKAALLKQIDLALTNSGQLGLTMSEPIASGDWRLFFLDRDRIKQVKAEDVLRVAKSYLKPSNRTLGLFIPTDKPDRAEIPGLTSLSAVLRDYKGGEAVAQGENFDSSPANIDARTIRGTLGSGMKLIMLPKKTRANSVNAVIVLHFGNAETLQNKEEAPAFAASMLMRGTSKHTRQQLTEELNRLKAQIGVSGSSSSARLSIQTNRENLPAVMKLAAEILREPVFPENEFDQMKTQQLAGVESMRTDPQAIAMAAFRQHMAPYPAGDPRYAQTPDETIAALKATTLDSTKKFYQGFYGASNAEMVVTGDFDPEVVQQLASASFGSWKSPQPFAKLSMDYKDIPAEVKAFETPDKANATFVIGMPVRITDESPDYSALLLANYILGSGMNSRLFQEVRGKQGLSYGVMSQLAARPKQDGGMFIGMAIYAPQNAAKVEAAMKKEITRAIKEPYTDVEIAEAKKGWLQQQSVSRSEDRELVGLLDADTYEGRTLAFQAALETKVNAVTAKQVSDAMQRNMDPAKLSIYKAGDFKKAQ